MMIQATDGKFYRDPTVTVGSGRTAFQITAQDGEILLLRVGKCSWNTAQRSARCGGVKVSRVMNLNPQQGIFDARLKACTGFLVTLNSPIPVPDSHRGVLSRKPEPHELGGEEILSWTN